MFVDLPDVVDAWRMVTAGRGFEGRLPLSSMPRLRDVLSDAQGDVSFALDFGRDALLVSYLELRIEAELPLVCQRSLQRFLQPVQVVQRLGLIRDEADEAAMPESYEPLLVPEDGQLRLAELIEDELILAVPLIPVSPESESLEHDRPGSSWPVPPEEESSANPFSALAALKKN